MFTLAFLSWIFFYLQWNGHSFLSLWEIFSYLCCMHASRYGSWIWTTKCSPSRFWNCNIPNSAPNFSTSSHVWASHIFTWGGNVKLYPFFSTLSYLLNSLIDILYFVHMLLIFWCRFGTILASRAIRAAHCLTSIQVSLIETWVPICNVCIYSPGLWCFLHYYCLGLIFYYDFFGSLISSFCSWCMIQFAGLSMMTLFLLYSIMLCLIICWSSLAYHLISTVI